MKITFILPAYPWKPMGGFRVIYEYANHLVARGHDVTVLHSSILPNRVLPSPANLYHWLRRKAGYFINLLVYLTLTPKVKWQPIDKRVKMLYVPEPIEKYVPDADAVFATLWLTAKLVLEYPRSKGKKFYLVQDFYPYMGDKFQIEKTWRFPIKKVTVSSWLYKIVIDSGISKNDVIAIPNGIDTKRFCLQNDIIDRPKRIAMMYSTQSYKAPDDGIKAIEFAKEKYKNIQAICFGAGSRPKHLPRWIEYAKNVSEKKLVEIYNFSSIFLSSSLSEGFAFPPAEAMACGCAVVATDSGGIREYAEYEKTALLSPPGNQEAIAKNLLRVLENDILRIRIAKAGYQRIQEFTWEKSTYLLEQSLLISLK